MGFVVGFCKANTITGVPPQVGISETSGAFWSQAPVRKERWDHCGIREPMGPVGAVGPMGPAPWAPWGQQDIHLETWKEICCVLG